MTRPTLMELAAIAGTVEDAIVASAVDGVTLDSAAAQIEAIDRLLGQRSP